jgi:hypothetical protein
MAFLERLIFFSHLKANGKFSLLSAIYAASLLYLADAGGLSAAGQLTSIGYYLFSGIIAPIGS